MHREALMSNDRLDQIRASRFAKYIDVTFSHPEYFMSNFSRDIVPENENYTWEFTVSNAEMRNITWTLSGIKEPCQ